MAVILFPYKAGSASCKSLAETLGIKRVKAEGSRWKGRGGDILINWGSTKADVVERAGEAKILNHPNVIRVSVDKLKSFNALKAGEVKIPKFTTDKAEALEILRAGNKVVCRTVLNGHSGQGIVIAEAEDQLVDAPLYVQYIPKKTEYRVHVMNGECFFIQRKARKLDVPDAEVNWKVRNLEGGFIYANQDVEAPDEVKVQAKKAITALGMDFGAVDIIVTNREAVYVLEINSACGLAGTTLEKYSEAFRKQF